MTATGWLSLLSGLSGLALVASSSDGHAMNVDSLPPAVSVMPVILVPYGAQNAPQQQHRDRFSQHLQWAQNRYQQMLGNCPALTNCFNGRTTFALATTEPVVIYDQNEAHTAAFYGADAGGGFILELLQQFGFDRYNNPYIFCIVVWDVAEYYGIDAQGAVHHADSYGRSINGGYNTGGGLVAIYGNAWWSLNLQSTLQHELGHSFGLPHSWQAGFGSNPRYDQNTGLSIMSYNKNQYTNGYEPASAIGGVDGILLPEEINLLSTNKRVFPNLWFDPATDMYSNYGMQTPTADLSSFELDQFATGFAWNDYRPEESVSVSTATTWAGAPSNILYAPASTDPVTSSAVIQPGTASFDSNSMWMSGLPVNGWVSVTVGLINDVTLTGIAIHSGFANFIETTDEVCLRSADNLGYVACQIVGPDDVMPIPPTTNSSFTFYLRSPTNQSVTLRGLQLMTPEGEIFPHRRPVEMLHYPTVTTAFGEDYDSKVDHVVAPLLTPDTAAAGYAPTTMWHSGWTNSLGWVSVVVTFPYPVMLSGVEAHTQHSGRYHTADQVQVEYLNQFNQFTTLAHKATNPDDVVPFTAAKATTWKIDFHSTDGYVTVRGLRFYTPVYTVYPDQPTAIVYHP